MAVLDFFYVLHIMFLSCLSILLYLALFFPPWIYIYIFFSSFDIPLSVSESASSIEIFNDLWLISLSLHLHTLYFGLLLTHIPTTFISDPGWFHVKCNCIIQEWLWYAMLRLERERGAPWKPVDRALPDTLSGHIVFPKIFAFFIDRKKGTL